MTDDRYNIERVWAFVHGELAEKESADMESALGADPRLRDLVTQIRAMHEKLEEFVPAMDQSDDELRERIMNAWEASQTPDQVEADIDEDEAPSSFSWGWSIFAQPRLVPVALAAALVAAVGFFALLPRGGVVWMPSDISPVTYRGGDAGAGEATRFYTIEDMRRFESDIQSAVTESFESLADAGKRVRWRTKATFRESHDGRIHVQIDAYGRDRKVVRETWTESFSNGEDFTLNSADFGARVGEELSAMSREANR